MAFTFVVYKSRFDDKYYSTIVNAIETSIHFIKTYLYKIMIKI